MDYFKHDINASEDDKVCNLLATSGYEMLGYYWRFIEYLYSRGGRIAKSKINGVAWSLHMDVEKLLRLINDYDLFVDDGEYILSKRVLAEVSEFEANGKKMVEAGRRGGQASAKARAQARVEGGVEPPLQGGLQGGVEALVNGCSTKKKKENKRKENKINIGGDVPDAPFGGAPSPAEKETPPSEGDHIPYQNANGNTLTYVWKARDTGRYFRSKFVRVKDYILDIER